MKSGPALRTALAFLFVCGVLYLVAVWLESKTAGIKGAVKPKPATAPVEQASDFPKKNASTGSARTEK